jgi:hypothetical protein
MPPWTDFACQPVEAPASARRAALLYKRHWQCQWLPPKFRPAAPGFQVLARFQINEWPRIAAAAGTFPRSSDLGHVAFGPVVPHDLRSVTKSILDLLYGIAGQWPRSLVAWARCEVTPLLAERRVSSHANKIAT